MQKVENISFGSKFVNTSTLRGCFLDAKDGLYRGKKAGTLVKSLEALLNDGNSDVIEISTTMYRPYSNPSVVAKINDKTVASNVFEKLCQTSECDATVRLLSHLAKKNNPNVDINLLADYEKKAIQPLMENLRTFVKTQSETSNLPKFFETINNIKNKIDEKLYETNISRLLNEVKPKIFDNK